MIGNQDTAELRKRIEELEIANQALEQFAFVASHDLREPLRVISQYILLLERTCGEQLTFEGREYLRFIFESAARMRSVIDDLWSYTKFAASECNPNFSTFDATVAARAALDNLRCLIRDSLIDVNVEPLPTVRADLSLLTRVFQNLIENAVKYRNSKGDPYVVIRGKRQGAGWQFSVEDNGIGMDEGSREHIFLFFHRLHHTAPGTGIGLAVCKRIIEHHGGRIWVESTPGKGSVFHFTLPVNSTDGESLTKR